MQVPSSFLVPGARVGVVGSRSFSSPGLVASFIESLPEGVVVVSGEGGVVDLQAHSSARDCGLRFCGFPAEWERFSRAAGPLRNQFLVAGGLSCLVVFLECPGRPSPGSASCIRAAREAGIPVFLL